MGRGRQFSFDVVIEYSGGGERRRLRCTPLVLGLAAGVFGLSLVGASSFGARHLQRDDLPTSLTAEKKQSQLAYESRIIVLRRRIDELAGRQLIDKDSVEGKMQTLVRRQAQLETRAAAVSQIVERALTSGVTAIARASHSEPGPAARGNLLGAANAYAPAGTSPRLQPQPLDEPYELRLDDGAKPTPLPPSDDQPVSAAARGSSAALAPVADPSRPLSQRLQSLGARLENLAREQRERLAGVLRPALKETA